MTPKSHLFLIGTLCVFGFHASAHELTWGKSQNRYFPPTILAVTDTETVSSARSSAEEEVPLCRLKLSLVDADTGDFLPGLVKLTDEDGVVEVRGLVNRGLGLDADRVNRQWYALPKPAVISVPSKPLTIEAISGMDSELSRRTLDLTGKSDVNLRLKLKRLTLLDGEGYVTGNTHVHLRRISRDAADEYLQAVSSADQIDLVFVSYLLRTAEDKTYISNEYRPKDLESLSTPATTFAFGEEHRNNFEAYGEGYGHVMFLDIDSLIHPVSIGASIMDSGPDFPNLKRGIDQAHGQGATVVWCHNAMGHEDIPNWVSGKVHAQNIFDGGNHGSYSDSFYRYLNAGMRVPFSTGTDWFIYDFSRVYARLNSPLSTDNWLEALEEGRTFITNGPLLQFSIEGQESGDTISLASPGSVKMAAEAQGRDDFCGLELVVNGEVVHAVSIQKVQGHYEAKMNYELSIDKPSWVALRVPETNGENAFGRTLFAHTSPVYINLSGASVFSVDAAESLISEMRTSIDVISERAQFESGEQQQEILDYYYNAIQEMERRIEDYHGSP